MSIKFKHMSLVLLLTVFQLSAIMAESGVVGDKITLKLFPETEDRYPNLLSNSCKWDIFSGDKNAITLVGVQDQATVTILSEFSGTIKIVCRYQIWDSSSLSNLYKNKEAYFDITYNSSGGGNPGGGGDNPGGGGGSGGHESLTDYFITKNTVEGIPMTFFITKDQYGATVAWLQQGCISSANGRVTIPDHPEGYPLYPVRKIDFHAFQSLSGLTELVIPETVTSVGQITSGCFNLKTIICEAYYPPTATMSKIANNDYECTVYVPQGSKSVYMQAQGWKNFRAIKEIGGVEVEGIDINSTNFPDEEFRKSLYKEDYGKDGVITDKEINEITAMSISSDVSNLKGIENFKNLEHLSIRSDKLTSLNVSQLTALYQLHLYSEKTKSNVLENIINNLPLNVYTKRHDFVVGDEKLLSSQLIDNTRLQGWTPCYMDGFTSYQKYPSDDPTGINLLETSLPLNIGESFTMGYIITPLSSLRNVTWNSEDTSIASVDYEGVIKGHKQGTTYIRATAPNGVTGSCKVTVSDPTSIQNIKMDTNLDASIYNLNGQRLDKPRKGINIIRGKKVVIK